MLFRPALIEKIIAGKKTQTRRLQHPGDWYGALGPGDPWPDVMAVDKNGKERIRFSTGSEYKIQPGRGKKTVIHNGKPLTIAITGIRSEDVRQISLEDAIAEGFTSQGDFWLTWIDINDKAAYQRDRPLWGVGWMWARPANLYQAWALTFKVVSP